MSRFDRVQLGVDQGDQLAATQAALPVTDIDLFQAQAAQPLVAGVQLPPVIDDIMLQMGITGSGDQIADESAAVFQHQAR